MSPFIPFTFLSPQKKSKRQLKIISSTALIGAAFKKLINLRASLFTEHLVYISGKGHAEDVARHVSAIPLPLKDDILNAGHLPPDGDVH